MRAHPGTDDAERHVQVSARSTPGGSDAHTDPYPGNHQPQRGRRFRRHQEEHDMTTTKNYIDRRWTALILLCVAEFVVVLDASIVNVALPSIGKGLHISNQNLPWVVDAYFDLLRRLLAARRPRRRPARQAARLHGRADRCCDRLAARGVRHQPSRADRCPCRAGLGRCDPLHRPPCRS